VDKISVTMTKIVVLIFAVHRALWVVRTGIMHDTLAVTLSTVWKEPNNISYRYFWRTAICGSRI